MEKENREVKNSVLVDLMYEDETAEENERSFYNALHEEGLPENTEIEKIRVDNVLYMNFKNDFSFNAGGKVLVLGEHQSTLNENMPLRELMYVGRVMEKLIPVRDRYKKKKVKLPTPEFYTLYNGQDHMGKETILKLSDAYEVQTDDPAMELKVHVININPRAGHEILEKCPVLKEYGIFIDTIRKYQKAGAEAPYEKAIRECIEKGVLADYLKRKGSEVMNMLTAEYDYETDLEVQREEAYEEGEKSGRKQGEKIGREQGEKIGREQGEKIGREQGEKIGQKQGERNKLIQMVIKKYEKSYSAEETADMLEEEVEEIEKIYEVLRKQKGSYTAKEICEQMK